MHHSTLWKTVTIIAISTVILVACNNATTPPLPTTETVAEAKITAATSTPTSVATVPLPTAAPTSTPAPPTPTATLTTKATDTAAPTVLAPTEQTYTVQELDTLLDIAIKFDTTVEAIITANNIGETDFLQIGQELIIPPPGQTATETKQTETTPAEISATSTPAAVAEVKNAEAIPQATSTAQPTQSVPAKETSTDTQDTAKVASQPAQPQVEQPPAAPPPSAPSGPPLPKITHAANINPLTGLPVADPSVLNKRPILVRIGNDAGARAAQLGLNRADMVYEEITEWWVTRFSAIFLSDIPDTVAPIRSTRLINVQLGPQYQAAVAHSGGSDPVRWEMTQIPIANLDQWFHGSLFFHRPNEGWMTRAAFKASETHPYLAANGLDKFVNLDGFSFSKAISTGEPAQNIFIPYPQATSFTQWSYNSAGGKYLRYVKDAPLYDAADGTQIAASNVIVYFAEHEETDIVEDSNGGTSIRPHINGTGTAWFFRDGKLNKGSWQTDGTRTPYFAYSDGTPFPLKPGNTWVEVVPTYFTIGLNSADEASSRP